MVKKIMQGGFRKFRFKKINSEQKSLRNAEGRSGFTLIELSILLVIFSFIAVTLFTTRDTPVVARKNTKLNIETIKLALEQYFVEYGYYPCPADGELGIDNSSFGKGDGSGTAACTSMNFSSADSPAIRIGVVPVKDLGLATEDIVDEWNRRITYAVSQDMTNSSARTNCGNITILKDFDSSADPDAQSSADTAIKVASYIVISHGKDGIGAYPYEGGSSRIAAVDLGGSNYVDSSYQQLNHHDYGIVHDGIFLKLKSPQQTP